MKTNYWQFKLLMMACVLFCSAVAMAQVKYLQGNSRQDKEFNKLLNEASVVFSLPEGFKEITPVSTDEQSFDYAVTTAGHELEIWFAVKPYKQISRNYNSPDSAYAVIGKTAAENLSDDNFLFTRSLTSRVLSQYGADAGKSYLLNLSDSPVTRHYKYALIITLQKNHTGAILAVCLTNDKGPDFFRNIDKARNCIRFK